MAVASKIISPIVTPGLTQTDSTARLSIGTVVHTDMGGSAEYVYALSELSQYAFVCIFDGGTAQMATTTLANDGGAGSKKIGCPQASIASGYYGWALRQGVFVGRFAAATDDNVPLFTSATAGELSDTTVSNCLVAGVYMNTSQSLATALTCYGATPMYIHPFVNPT